VKEDITISSIRRKRAYSEEQEGFVKDILFAHYVLRRLVYHPT